MAKFVKGQSGNPGGRPKELPELKELARTHAELAIQTLVEVATNPQSNSYARVSAAVALLDRGFGKPTQAVEHSGQIDMGVAALLAAIDGKTRGLPNKKK